MEQNERLTYRSMFGDYGINVDIEGQKLIHTLANALGRYEDLGSIEELKALMAQKKEGQHVNQAKQTS